MNAIKPLLALSLLLLAACGSEQEAGDPSFSSAPLPGEAVTRERQQPLSQDYAEFRASQISDVSYQLSLRLDESSDLFNGRSRIDFTLAPGNASPVTVDFDQGEILSLEVNGQPGDYDYERWYITLEPGQFREGANSIAIDYRRPYSTDGAGLHKFTDPENGEVYLYTNFQPYDANRLFPHFDQPDLRAPIELDVLAPASWQVIGNTRERAITTTGDERRHWEFPPSARISSYIYAMHAGPFEVWEDSAGDIPLRLFARGAIAPYVQPEEWFVPTRQSFAFFQEYFGIPYPFGKYDQVVVPDFNAGAMENVGAVTFNERYISRGEKSTAQLRSLANVIAHEMAHMWFGDLVTMQWWNGLWLNESFATYMANLALERSSDFENVWDAFYSDTKQWAYETDQLVTTHPIELEVPTTADAFTNFDGITYGKGASVLKQLPYFLGEENFRRGVSNYLEKYSYANTNLEDFVGELALAADMDLDRWERQWLHMSGVNTLQASFSCENGELASLRLQQSVPEVETADMVLRSQRTQVGLYRYTDGAMTLVEAIPVTYAGASTTVQEAAGLPCPDLVFPNVDDWAYVKVQLDDASVATLEERINDFNDASIRIMLWQSLWDAVRDAEMPLTGFVDFALANIGVERDPNIVSQVAGNLGSAFGLLSRMEADPDLREDYKARVEDFLRGQLVAAQPGSDLQKTWFSALTGAAHRVQALDWLAALLDGEESLQGLGIDQDRRWRIVIALNRHLHGNYEARTEDELARDNSDIGNNMALSARAVRPLRETKREWLDIVQGDPGRYKLATLRTVMSYLFPPEQKALEEEFADRLLEPLPEINADASQEYVDSYVGTLIPATCSEANAARLDRANESFADFQPLIVKAFLIAEQEDRRCLEMARLLPSN